MVHKGFRSMYTLSVVFCNLFIEVKFMYRSFTFKAKKLR